MRIQALTLAIATVLGLAGSQVAHATTNADLCSSVPSACEFTGPNAPVLAVNVCWSRLTATTRLMTGATCPTGSYVFFLKYGIVDPLTQIVTGLVPLPDACSRPGICTPGSFAPPSGWTTAAMCCIDGVCWPATNGFNCNGELLFCDNGVSNEDGTVECFDDQDV